MKIYFLIAFFAFFFFSLPLEAATSVKTTDGLALLFSDTGQVTSLAVDNKSVSLIRDAALFHLRDAVAQSAFAPVETTVDSLSTGLHLQSSNHPDNLDLDATLTSHGSFIQIDGTLTGRDRSNRCIDLKISLPIASSSYAFGAGLSAEPPHGKKSPKKLANDDPDTDASVSDDSSMYPLAPASDISAGVGLSLAVPPTCPTRFITGLDDTGLYILIRIGLSPSSASPSQTPFHVILYRHDPAWGFRSSLERYYRFYNDPFFTRRVKKIGLWTTHNLSQLLDKDLYAYHEAGSTAWGTANNAAGMKEEKTLENIDEGPLAHSLEDFEKLCELPQDAAAGIASLPYTIVGQCQFIHLPALPTNYEEAMHVLDTWTTDKPILFNGPAQSDSFRSADELKAIIRNSTIEDSQHHLQYFARAYRGPTLTFVENPNPNLFDDSDKQTIAKYTLDYYLPMMLKSKYVDGLYTDSLGRWCSFFNYRIDHFKYSTVPLTYAGSPPQPCIWNLASHAEYLWDLSARLHKLDKIVFANGVHSDRVMLGFDCDAMGCEGTPAYTIGEKFYASRVAAGAKPYCYLNATGKATPRLWNSCLYMGYLLSCNTEVGAPLMRKYEPSIIKMNQAGWEPLTYAHATPPSVGIERWGKFSTLYFSLMNRSTSPVTAEIRIDTTSLSLPPTTQVSDAIIGEAITTELNKSKLVAHFQLAPEAATVIQLLSPAGHG